MRGWQLAALRRSTFVRFGGRIREPTVARIAQRQQQRSRFAQSARRVAPLARGLGLDPELLRDLLDVVVFLCRPPSFARDPPMRKRLVRKHAELLLDTEQLVV